MRCLALTALVACGPGGGEPLDPECYEGVALEVELPDAMAIGYGGPQAATGVHVWSAGNVLGLRPEHRVVASIFEGSLDLGRPPAHRTRDCVHDLGDRRIVMESDDLPATGTYVVTVGETRFERDVCVHDPELGVVPEPCFDLPADGVVEARAAGDALRLPFRALADARDEVELRATSTIAVTPELRPFEELDWLVPADPEEAAEIWAGGTLRATWTP